MAMTSSTVAVPGVGRSKIRSVGTWSWLTMSAIVGVLATIPADWVGEVTVAMGGSSESISRRED
jgi:hypothetical protein